MLIHNKIRTNDDKLQRQERQQVPIENVVTEGAGTFPLTARTRQRARVSAAAGWWGRMHRGFLRCQGCPGRGGEPHSRRAPSLVKVVYKRQEREGHRVLFNERPDAQP